MTDPELLKLARQARNALWVIAGSSAIVGFAAAMTFIPPLAAFVHWMFFDSVRSAMIVGLVLFVATLAFIAWALAKDTPSAHRPTPIRE